MHCNFLVHWKIISLSLFRKSGHSLATCPSCNTSIAGEVGLRMEKDDAIFFISQKGLLSPLSLSYPPPFCLLTTNPKQSQWLILGMYYATSKTAIYDTSGYSSLLQGLVWVYCPGQAGVPGNKWAELLASSAPAAGTIAMGKISIVKTIYECLLVDNIRADNTAWSRMTECDCGSCDGGVTSEENKLTCFKPAGNWNWIAIPCHIS